MSSSYTVANSVGASLLSCSDVVVADVVYDTTPSTYVLILADVGDASGGSGGATADSASSKYRGAQGLDPEFIKELEAQFGFDKPPLERFLKMLGDYARFDFGESYFRDIKIIDLIAEKLPVSISLGLWMTLISYAVSIPLGIRKAVSDGSRFDVWTSGVIVVAYAIPGFLFAVLLIVLFAGGSFWDIFPLRGLGGEREHPSSTLSSDSLGTSILASVTLSQKRVCL